MKRILLALIAAAAFAFTVGTSGTADARPYVRVGVGFGPSYGAYYRPYGSGGYGYGGYGYGAYRPYSGGYSPYVRGYSVNRAYYGGGGYGYAPARYYRGAPGRRCW